MPIQVQVLTALLLLRDRLADAVRHVRDDERGELTGSVIFLAALGRGRRRRRRRSSSPGSTPTPTRSRTDGAPRRGERGLVATVIVLPALLLSFWLVLQYAIVAHVRHVAQAAAQDAALAAASGDGRPGTRPRDGVAGGGRRR